MSGYWVQQQSFDVSFPRRNRDVSWLHNYATGLKDYWRQVAECPFLKSDALSGEQTRFLGNNCGAYRAQTIDAPTSFGDARLNRALPMKNIVGRTSALSPGQHLLSASGMSDLVCAADGRDRL